MLLAQLTNEVFHRKCPAVIAQLNTTDAAARQSAWDVGLPTGGLVPQGRYDVHIRHCHGVQEAESDSFRRADIGNVTLAKDVAFNVAAKYGLQYPSRHEASCHHAVHVGLLYAPKYTNNKPSGAGTYKASACLASPEQVYLKGYKDLPRPEGLDAAWEKNCPVFHVDNRFFVLDLRSETAAATGAALGQFLSNRRVFSIVISGPAADMVSDIDVGAHAQNMFTRAFCSAGYGATSPMRAAL